MVQRAAHTRASIKHYSTRPAFVLGAVASLGVLLLSEKLGSHAMACEPEEKVWGMIFFSPFYIIFNTSKVHVNKIIIHSCTLFLLSFAVCFLCFEKLLHLCTLSGAAEAAVRLPSTAAIYTVCFTDKFLSWPWLTVKSLHPLYVISAKWKTL